MSGRGVELDLCPLQEKARLSNVGWDPGFQMEMETPFEGGSACTCRFAGIITQPDPALFPLRLYIHKVAFSLVLHIMSKKRGREASPIS